MADQKSVIEKATEVTKEVFPLLEKIRGIVKESGISGDGEYVRISFSTKDDYANMEIGGCVEVTKFKDSDEVTINHKTKVKM